MTTTPTSVDETDKSTSNKLTWRSEWLLSQLSLKTLIRMPLADIHAALSLILGNDDDKEDDGGAT